MKIKQNKNILKDGDRHINYQLVHDFKGKGKNCKAGLINRITGEVVVDYLYDAIWRFNDGLCRVIKDMKSNQYSFIDKTGAEIIPPLTQYDFVDDFSEGLALVKSNDKFGYIDTTGDLVIPLKYTGANRFKESLAAVILFIPNSDDQFGVLRYGFIDKSGREVVPFRYRHVQDFKDGLAIVCVKDGEDYKYGFIDKTSEVVIPIMYDWLDTYFIDGLCNVKLGDKYGFINKRGEVVIPIMYDCLGTYFIDGLCCAGIFTEIERFIDRDGIERVKLDKKYGFINKKGEWKIQPKYRSVGCFYKGLCRVGINGKKGLINRNGKIVLPIIYNEIEYHSFSKARVRLNGEWFLAKKKIYRKKKPQIIEESLTIISTFPK